MKRIKKNLSLTSIQAVPSSYLDDVYLHYFQPSPQPCLETIPHHELEDQPKNDLKPILTCEAPTVAQQPSSGRQQEFKKLAKPTARYAKYRDSPIITRSSSSLLSLDIPNIPRRHFWDPKLSDWRVVDFENYWDLDGGQGIEISEPHPTLSRRNAIKHTRQVSEPGPSLPLTLSTPKTRFVFSELLRDTKDTHPTLELALRYSEPSPLVSTFNTATTDPDEDSQLQRRIQVQVLGAINLQHPEHTAMDRVGSFACVSIADKEFTTSVVKGLRPWWNAQFEFESVRDTDPFEIYVWNDIGPASLQGTFVATIRRILLMQALNEDLTLTLDRWPGEMELMESSRSGSVIIRVRDITEYSWHEEILPSTPVENLSHFSLESAQDPTLAHEDESLYQQITDNISFPNSESTKETRLVEEMRRFADITGRVLSLKKGRYPWIPVGDITITAGPVCGGRYCDVYIGELKRPQGSFQVAMKQLRVFINASDNMRKLFCREVRFWNGLRHPNVLPFWGCWELDEYRLFMISPWAPNGNSLEYVKKNPTANRCQLLRQTSEALAYLHSGIDGPAIVHGDLKADNVLISGNGSALLADFGLTRYVQKLAEVTGTPSGLSPHGHVRFSAPELLLPKSGADPRPTPESDVFAFGCFIIQLYTEELPYREIKSDPHLFMEVVKGRVPSRPLDLPKERGFDDYIWSVATGCWEFEAKDRPSMRRVADKLKLRLDINMYDYSFGKKK